MEQQRAVAQLKALGEPHRLGLVLRIARKEMGGTDLLRATGLSQPNLSRHLRVLREAGVILERWSGRNAYYILADEPLTLGIVGLLGGRVPAPATPDERGSSTSINIPDHESNPEPSAPEVEDRGGVSAPMEDWLL